MFTSLNGQPISNPYFNSIIMNMFHISLCIVTVMMDVALLTIAIYIYIFQYSVVMALFTHKSRKLVSYEALLIAV